MVKRFVRLDRQHSPLKDFIMNHIDIALGIQNDADELFTGETLNYLRHCALKPGVQTVLAPAIAFKKNYHWLLHTIDMQCLRGNDVHLSIVRDDEFSVRQDPSLTPLPVPHRILPLPPHDNELPDPGPFVFGIFFCSWSFLLFLVFCCW